jgi:hypothetical protein
VRGEVKRGEVKRGEESRSESDVTHPKNPKKKLKHPHSQILSICS